MAVRFNLGTKLARLQYTINASRRSKKQKEEKKKEKRQRRREEPNSKISPNNSLKYRQGLRLGLDHKISKIIH